MTKGIENKESEFKVTINPFLQTITIEGRLHNLINQEIELTYNELDEWNSFELFGDMYDIHLLYDTKPQVSIYQVVEFIGDQYTEKVTRDVTLIIKI